MPRSNSSTVIANSSGEDEEFEEARPKKRRRKAERERERDQPTYTQFVRSPRATRKTPKYDLDEDGFEIFRDEAELAVTPMGRIRRGLQQRATGLECTDWTANDGDGDETELPPGIANSSSQAEMVPSHPTPRVYRTPNKVRFTNTIPSSQSPASAKLSTQRSQRFRDAELSPLKHSPFKHSPLRRSPLKEKSGNVPSPARLQGGEKASQNDATLLNAPPSPLAVNPVTVPPLKLSRTLKRVSTVQDSQYEEDLELPISPDEDDETDAGLNVEETADETYDYDDDDYDEIQPTYDPANAALERDAARFFRTQTQARTQTQTQANSQAIKLEPHVSNSTCSDDDLSTEDEVDDDLDRVQRVLHSTREAAKGSSPELGDQLSQRLADPASQRLDQAAREHADGAGNESVLSSHPVENAEYAVAASPLGDEAVAHAVTEPDFPVLRSSEVQPRDHGEEEGERVPSSPPAKPVQMSRHSAAITETAELRRARNEQIEDEDEDEKVPSSSPRLIHKKPEAAAGSRPSSNELPRDDNAEEEGGEDVVIPSSPPPSALRPSQVSTRCSPDTLRIVDTTNDNAIPLTFSSPTHGTHPTDHKTAAVDFSYPQTLPSSPFPAFGGVGWSSSPRRPAFLETQTLKGVLDDGLGSLGDGFADFSLPPPPFMSSSSNKAGSP